MVSESHTGTFSEEASLPSACGISMPLASEQGPLELPHRVLTGPPVSIASSGPVTPHVRVTQAVAALLVCPRVLSVTNEDDCGAQARALCPIWIVIQPLKALRQVQQG